MILSTAPSYWLKGEPIQNFGDYLSEFLLCELFMPAGISCNELRIVGSCIHDYLIESALNDKDSRIVFWGCGLRDESGIGNTVQKASRFLAVRGPLTRSILKLDDDIPIGDPGLLLPALYTPQVSAAFFDATLLVPHFHDHRSDKELKSLSGCDRILRPNIDNNIEATKQFIDRLTSANFILCGSLHAAIVATAYGKDFGFWNSGNIDLPFKWQDFAASISVPCQFLNTATEAKVFYIHSIREQLKIPILWPMLVVAPMIVKPEIITEVVKLDHQRHGDKIFHISLPKATSHEIIQNVYQALESTRLQEAEYCDQIGHLNHQLDERNEQIMRLNQIVVECEETITAIRASKSWRITAPLRIMKTTGSQTIIQFHRMSGKIIRRIYHSLPLSYYKKAELKDWTFRNFSALVSWTNTYKRWAEYKGLIADHTVANIKQKGYLLTSKKREGTLKFDDPSDPLVSIVIPVYNNWIFTEACLWSIKNNSGTDVAYEVIIADDCSTDETKSRLAEISGLKVLANEKNLGFLRNCNNAVKHTRGRYIVLLNNDTEVSPNWLVLMLNVFSNFDQVGVVAAKLIYPDSRVQEAGGIMMSNGWAHPYGRFEDPEKYEFNYVKEVDCAIGACLMIEKALFERIGGFDERYAPAHYEEFDFEFSVRACGYKVMYQPAVQIIHYESVSGGSEFRDRQSIINREKFCEKWATELASRPVSETGLYLARDSSINSKCILVIEDMVPHHDKNAGAVTIFQYIKLLRNLGFKVVFLPNNLNPVQPYTSDLQQMGIEVIYGKFDFQAWFGTNGKKFDYCWLCRPDVSIKYIDIIRAESSACILYYTHDLHYLREYRCYELEGDKWHLQESNRLKAIELEIFRHVNVVLTPSSDEEMIIRELSPKSKILTIPAYMYETSKRAIASETHGYKERKGLLFLGGYNHAPNVDAVLWFTKEVFPLIRFRLPDVVFCVAGSNVPDEIQKLDGSAIQVRGYVSDLSKLFNEFRVFVAPLRYGAGVKGKIVTSLYYGVPVVTTSIGNEGLGLTNGDQALVGDSAMELADQISKLYQEPDLWEQLSARGGDYIRERFSIESARNAILRATSVVAERCYICGKNVFFSPDKDISNLRESHICSDCWTLKRTNDLAYVLVQLHGRHKKDSLCSMLDVLSKLDIYEIGFVGPIHDLLSEIPGFVCSEYFDDVAIGEIGALGIRCEDVERLTFPSMSFDLIISQDVFEHVPNPVQGFREIFRVLKNGGIHAFTIPYSKYRAESLQRARIDDGVIQWLTEPVYHGDPIREKGALVFTDFGRDLVNSLTQIGFQIELHEFEFPEYQGGSNTVFIARKPTDLQ